MTRWLGVIGIGLLAALLAFALLRPSVASTAAERTDAIAATLRCPDCQSLSVADSHTASAVEIRRQIGQMVATDASDEEVRQHFVDRYGEWILLAPSAPLVWIVPFVVAIFAVMGLGAWMIRRGRTVPTASSPLTEAERRRLHDEVEALDA